MCDPNDNIDVATFINKEDEWLAMNYERIFNNVQSFKDFDFNAETGVVGDSDLCTIFVYLFSFLIGFFAIFLIFLPMYTMRKKIGKKTVQGMMFGCSCKLIYIAFYFYLKQELVMFY